MAPPQRHPRTTCPLPALACQHSCARDACMHRAHPGAFPDWGRWVPRSYQPVPRKSALALRVALRCPHAHILRTHHQGPGAHGRASTARAGPECHAASGPDPRAPSG
eukprot:15403253-Alexandrium_andersonii.AAC.1